jgi:hypothetical protein
MKANSGIGKEAWIYFRLFSAETWLVLLQYRVDCSIHFLNLPEPPWIVSIPCQLSRIPNCMDIDEVDAEQAALDARVHATIA